MKTKGLAELEAKMEADHSTMNTCRANLAVLFRNTLAFQWHWSSRHHSGLTKRRLVNVIGCDTDTDQAAWKMVTLWTPQRKRFRKA